MTPRRKLHSIDIVPVGLVTLDKNGAILKSNSTAAKMLGVKRQDLQQHRLSKFVSRVSRQEWHSTRQTAFKSGISQSCELEMRKSDGSPLSVLIEIVGSSGARENQTCFVTLVENSKRKTEHERDQYRNDLKAMASELMLAEERERQRLSENLHDGLGQALFLARMKLDQTWNASAIDEVKAILEEMGKMINTMTFELSPVVLRKLGLRHAIMSLAANIRQRFGLDIDIQDDAQPFPLDGRIAVVLFRSVRELLINVAKHAKTNFVSISLSTTADTLHINVEDYGQGFDIADQARHVKSGHYGLFSIRERLEYLKGSFNIRSAVGKGTSVTLKAPIAPAKAAAADGSRRAKQPAGRSIA